ncbi:hypothetical protein EDD21DRAFT_375864 [Dissophora ornata]|nr:hypothetical protein EDD21DRAFT_375864 [Dissophora ornata]
MLTPQKIEKRRTFLAKYGSGPKSYFKNEGAVMTAFLALIIIGLGAFALSNEYVSYGYFFLLAFVGLVIALIGTFLAYHYQVTQARKTMASVPDPELGLHNPFDNSRLDQSWTDASIYVPPPAAAVIRSA